MKQINSYDFRDMKGLSKLFIDYLDNSEYIMSRFPGNRAKTADDIENKALTYQFREEIVSVIRMSMSSVELSEKQQTNLDKLRHPNCLTVVTGQQAGFLGGPLFTMLKAASTFEHCNELCNQFPTMEFVPVFWVEDNDHDGPEASRTYSLSGKSIGHYDCETASANHSRRMVSSREFDNSISGTIEQFISELRDSSYKEEIEILLKGIYVSGKKWNIAFIELMNRFFSSSGLLFLSATELIGSGICRPLIIKELSNPGKSYELVAEANRQLTENGYHLQAKSGKVNLFHHIDGERYRIEPQQADKMLMEAEIHPENFSPNVLLRPVFQDFALPTTAYIAGPGEIGYWTQIKELYEFFGVRMPAVLPRHSATVLDMKSERIIRKFKLGITYFQRNIDELIAEISEELMDDKLRTNLEGIRQRIIEIFKDLEVISSDADATLSQSAKAAGIKAVQSAESIEKKIMSALKRKNEEHIEQFMHCSNIIFPEGTIQERMINPVFFANLTGIDGLNTILNFITKLDRNKHHIVTIQ
jgi:bacillithiol biosynthesis cysteine-adding enzyme BshC